MDSQVKKLQRLLKTICGDDASKYTEILQFLETKDITTFSETSLISSDNPAKDLIVPRYKEHYYEIKKIGRGGFGEIFISRYHLDKKVYAIKKIPVYMSDTDFVDNYLSEILILSRLEHPNIVRYYTSWIENTTIADKTTSQALVRSEFDIGLEEYDSLCEISGSSSSINSLDDEPVMDLYIQMELCKPYNLSNLIHKISPDEVLTIIKSLIDGVKYLHSKNIIHRDINPKNILFSLETNDVKLADFGLSCLEHSGKRLSTYQGTYLYTDPHGECNLKTVDIYSIGVVITELLCKFTTRMERIEVLKKLKKAVIPEYIDDKIKKIIFKCIHYNVDERYDILELESVVNNVGIMGKNVSTNDNTFSENSVY